MNTDPNTYTGADKTTRQEFMSVVVLLPSFIANFCQTLRSQIRQKEEDLLAVHVLLVFLSGPE